MCTDTFPMHRLLTLHTSVFGRPTSFTRFCCHRTLNTRFLAVVQLSDIMLHSTVGGGTRVCDRITLRALFPDQRQGNFLQEILKVWLLRLHHVRVAVLCHDIGIVCAGHHQVVENTSPPLSGSMMLVAYHLIHQVDAFHVRLVVRQGCWDCYLLRLTLLPSCHNSHCCWIVEI